MCGIAGIVNLDGRPIDRDGLNRAVASMRHRGPDDDGLWYEEQPGFSVGFGATRLAILDTSSAGHQPMVSDDGHHAVVFNGLIYNYREIAAELASSGVSLRSGCDTEVVLAACRLWGTAAMSRFNGMFALAYVDRRTHRGFLARDRFGIKPLFYALTDQQILFASEMRTLRTLGDWPDELNRAALVHYLRMGFVAQPDTIFAAARRVPPGSFLSFDARGMAVPKTYYSIPVRTASDPIPDERDAAERVRSAIRHAVARRRVADVPIGAFLSGGVDSSIVVAHLAELSSRPVRTYSIGWSDESAYDETSHAAKVASRFGAEHTAMRCRALDVLDLLPHALDHLGEPFFDSSLLPTMLVSRLAREHVTVALSGDGADELLGGYWRYAAHDFRRAYHRVPALIRTHLLERLAHRATVGKGTWVQNRLRQVRKLLRAGSGDPFANHIAWSRILAPEADDLIDGNNDDPLANRIADATCDADPDDPLNRILAFDLHHSLTNDMLHKVDLASMYHSLEVRVPFLDSDVVATAMAMPSTMKIRGGVTKRVLKEAYRGILPDDVLERPKKGFEVPIGEFLRRELREMFHDVVTPQALASFDIIRPDVVQRLYSDHLARRGEHADLLFALLSLCWWNNRRRDRIST